MPPFLSLRIRIPGDTYFSSSLRIKRIGIIGLETGTSYLGLYQESMIKGIGSFPLGSLLKVEIAVILRVGIRLGRVGPLRWFGNPETQLRCPSEGVGRIKLDIVRDTGSV